MISKNEIIELIESAKETPTLDFKEDLHLKTDGDKAEFVKDVIALANSGNLAHIVVGVEDKTGKSVGLRTTHNAEQLNQILKDKCDPPISVEYLEKNILGYKIGVIEFKGGNPPYIVSVLDKFGGPLSSNPQKSFFIHRGTIFVRNYNMNEGARRADLDKMYEVKYVTLQAEISINHEVSVKSLDDSTEADIKFMLLNIADVVSAQAYVWMQFTNIQQLVRCTGKWIDVSRYNNNVPTINLVVDAPVCPTINLHCQGVIVRVNKDVDQIETRLKLGASNTRIKEGTYVIPLKK